MCTLEPEDSCGHLWGGFSIAPHAGVCRAQPSLVAAQCSPPYTPATSSCLEQIRAASAWWKCCSFTHRGRAGRKVLNTHICLSACCLPFLEIRWMSSCLRHTQPKSQIVPYSCWRHHIDASVYMYVYTHPFAKYCCLSHFLFSFVNMLLFFFFGWHLSELRFDLIFPTPQQARYFLLTSSLFASWRTLTCAVHRSDPHLTVSEQEPAGTINSHAKLTEFLQSGQTL